MEQIPSGTFASKDPGTKDSGSRKRVSRNRRISQVVHGNSTLTYEEQLLIVKAVAIHTPDLEVKDLVLKTTGKEITQSQISYYKSNPVWQAKREKFREEFESQISDEPLASKHIRIRELSKAYRRLEKQDKTLTDAVNVLSKIREEIEGKSSGNMTLTQYNQYNGLSDEELRKVIDENTRFLEIAEKHKKTITVEPDGQGT